MPDLIRHPVSSSAAGKTASPRIKSGVMKGASRDEDRVLRFTEHLGIIERVVEATALLAGQRRAHDQVRHLDEVAQLDQVGGHAEIAVIFLDLAAEQLDAVLRALEPLGGADDA